jgi:hypothetical protein
MRRKRSGPFGGDSHAGLNTPGRTCKHTARHPSLCNAEYDRHTTAPPPAPESLEGPLPECKPRCRQCPFQCDATGAGGGLSTRNSVKHLLKPERKFAMEGERQSVMGEETLFQGAAGTGKDERQE